MRIYKRRLPYMHASVNAHLWKLDFVYAHIRKHTYTEDDHFHISSFMEFGFHICSQTKACIIGSQLP
jgi:hypothetical protein